MIVKHRVIITLLVVVLLLEVLWFAYRSEIPVVLPLLGAIVFIVGSIGLIINLARIRQEKPK